ncbi:uncharacterized protein Z520_08827 [Fonsecaea multimorphosa CBS 102226]|uniref:Uncharacterized protein n=1 Tax=Fonsecaea multimorphosa CBS 102226 TaxID=1442371 RepID=A0A0D2H0H1_9EURO|nr:uncharacterized protein Z520_08827 [Fonsecaea multimorphosa CBS 102226]KIX95310.1 hypothetical protein Z520_08827 [Fonsecaea multimorphosa CBS 102226]OAL21109.1 hypothetical protein AYO22_08266 [Fonsecaea multimorphosa]
MSPMTLKTLAALRMLVGGACLLVPRHAGLLFGIPLGTGPEGVLLGRMAGVRDIVLGAYLWKRVRGWEEVANNKADGVVGADRAVMGGGRDMGRTPLLFNKDGDGDGIGATSPSPPPPTNPSSVFPRGREQGPGHGGNKHLQMAERESALRSAVWLGLVVDTIDCGSVIVGSLQGEPLSDLAKVTVGGGAVVFALIAGQHLVSSSRARAKLGQDSG